MLRDRLSAPSNTPSVPVVRDSAVKRIGKPLTLGLLLPALLLALLLTVPGLNPRFQLYSFHMWLVLPAAVFTAGVAIWMGYVGLRQRNASVVLLSLAFASLGLIYGAHGLGTPEVGMMAMNMAQHHQSSAVLPASAQLGTVLTAIWLLLSSFSSRNIIVRGLLALRGWLIGLWLLALVGLGALLFQSQVASLLVPSALPGKAAVMLLTLSLCLWTGVRYWASWRYSRFPLQLAVIFACGWLAAAQVTIVLNFVWTLSWWVYHVLLVMITVSLLTGLIAQYRQKHVPLGTALRGLWNNEPDDLLSAGISVPVRALVAQTEAHDTYTAGHAYRVSLYAMQLARALNCPPETLRAITQGGILHDLGKLDVPAEVLNFPGKLSPEAWAQVQQHPARGFERAGRLGLLPEELQIVRSHHERWDGAGYPDKLAGTEIPLLARIMSVADVFDALTSERSYRQPWSAERANALIASDAGKVFDPEIVAVWLSLNAEITSQQPEWVARPQHA